MTEKKKVLVTWVGDTDIQCILDEYDKKKKDASNVGGPIFALLKSKYGKNFDEIHLLWIDRGNSLEKDGTKVDFPTAIESVNNSVKIFIQTVDEIEDPTDFEKIYNYVHNYLDEIEVESKKQEEIEWHFHTSPGTPAMAAIWILLGKTLFPATLYKSYKNKKTENQVVKKVNVPFDISVVYQQLSNDIDKKIIKQWLKKYRNLGYEAVDKKSKELVKKAATLTMRNVPVLIAGKPGTGRETLAKYIGKMAEAANFRTFTCKTLQTDTLKRIFSGQDKDVKKGLNVLYFSEISDLDDSSQLELLNHFRYPEKLEDITLRIISATEGDLREQVNNDGFNEELYYYLSIGTLDTIPLNNRIDDISPIADLFLKKINEEFIETDVGNIYREKKLTDSAKRVLEEMKWKGNLNELRHLLKRICVFNSSSKIDAKDIHKYADEDIVEINSKSNLISKVENGEEIDLDEIFEKEKKDIINHVYKITGFNKSKTAKKLGYNSSHNIKRYLDEES